MVMRGTRAKRRWLVVAAIVACGGQTAIIPGIDGDDAATSTDAASGTDVSTPDATVVDAGVDAPNKAALCKAACEEAGVGTCDDAGACSVDCTGISSCFGKVACPPGIACNVACGLSGCSGGIDCTAASSCNIDCQGVSACAGAVTCGGTTCTVTCEGQSSCAGGVSCSASQSCDVTCSGIASCAGLVSCSDPSTATCTASCTGLSSCVSTACCKAKTCHVIGTTNGC